MPMEIIIIISIRIGWVEIRKGKWEEEMAKVDLTKELQAVWHKERVWRYPRDIASFITIPAVVDSKIPMGCAK